MRTVLGRAAGQVTVAAGGHGVLGNGVTCVGPAVTAFLLDGVLPGADRSSPGPRG